MQPRSSDAPSFADRRDAGAIVDRPSPHTVVDEDALAYFNLPSD